MPLTPIELRPLPTSSAIAARQAVEIGAQVAAQGRAATGANLLAAMLAVSADDPPSERRRLRVLYRDVYAAAELEALIDRTLDALGLED